MIAWILLIASALALFLMFLRRLRLTMQDVRFQKHLAKEEAVETGEDTPDAQPEPKAEKPSGSTRKLYLKGDTHFSRGEYEEAATHFLTIVELDSTHLDAHHKLGMLYMKLEDFPKAELYFSKLVNLKKDPIYFSNLGAALYQQQRLVEAAEAYENAISLDDKRAARLQSLAQVYYELGDDDKALHFFERAARRKPKDSALKILIAEYYEKLQRYDDAIRMVEAILEKDPYNKEAKAKLKALKTLAA